MLNFSLTSKFLIIFLYKLTKKKKFPQRYFNIEYHEKFQYVSFKYSHISAQFKYYFHTSIRSKWLYQYQLNFSRVTKIHIYNKCYHHISVQNTTNFKYILQVEFYIFSFKLVNKINLSLLDKDTHNNRMTIIQVDYNLNNYAQFFFNLKSSNIKTYGINELC